MGNSAAQGLNFGAGGGNSPFGGAGIGGGGGMPGFGLPGLGMPGGGGGAIPGMPANASSFMTSDTMMLVTSLNAMMGGLMAMIGALLAGILNGSISGTAPAGSGGAGGSGGTTATAASTGGGGNQPTGPVAPGTEGALDRARALLGKRGGDPAIDAITRQSGLDSGSQPWCAAFAMNILKDAGLIDTSGLSNMNYTPEIYRWAKEKGLWRDSGSYVPKPGDAIEFDWEGGRTGEAIDHIGIVEKVENGYVHTIEGNSSNAVNRRKYKIGEPPISGYIVSGGR